jgi:hypothetical protein
MWGRTGRSTSHGASSGMFWTNPCPLSARSSLRSRSALPRGLADPARGLGSWVRSRRVLSCRVVAELQVSPLVGSTCRSEQQTDAGPLQEPDPPEGTVVMCTKPKTKGEVVEAGLMRTGGVYGRLGARPWKSSLSPTTASAHRSHRGSLPCRSDSHWVGYNGGEPSTPESGNGAGPDSRRWHLGR